MNENDIVSSYKAKFAVVIHVHDRGTDMMSRKGLQQRASSLHVVIDASSEVNQSSSSKKTLCECEELLKMCPNQEHIFLTQYLYVLLARIYCTVPDVADVLRWSPSGGMLR